VVIQKKIMAVFEKAGEQGTFAVAIGSTRAMTMPLHKRHVLFRRTLINSTNTGPLKRGAPLISIRQYRE